MDDLDNLEQKLVMLAAKRYKRFYFRWGHLLGWLALPLGALMLVPDLKPYTNWMAWAAILLGFEWYFVVSTRVIGKLQARASGGS